MLYRVPEHVKEKVSFAGGNLGGTLELNRGHISLSGVTSSIITIVGGDTPTPKQQCKGAKSFGFLELLPITILL